MPSKGAVTAKGLKLEDYSDRAFVVRGNTYEHREKLKELGGKWSPGLRGGQGYVFSKKRKAEVLQWMGPSARGGRPADDASSSSSVGRVTRKKAAAQDEQSKGSRGKRKRRLVKPQVALADSDDEDDDDDEDDEDEEWESEEVDEEEDDDSEVTDDEEAISRERAKKRKKKKATQGKAKASQASKAAGGKAVQSTRVQPARAKKRKASKERLEQKRSSRRDEEDDDEEEDEEWRSEEEDEDEEEGEVYEGESDDDDEEEEIVVHKRGAGRAASSRGASGGGGGRRRSNEVFIRDVASNVMRGINIGGVARRRKSTAGGKASSSSSFGGKKKEKRAEGGFFFGGDFPELLPPAMASQQQARRQGAGGGPVWEVAGMTPAHRRRGLLLLPPDVFDDHLLPMLGQRELCRLHGTCKFFTLMLDEPKRWSRLPYLDVRYQTLSKTATTARGRSTAMPMDLVLFKIMRVLGQERLRGVTGVDLRGTSLGAGRGREGPSLLLYLTDKCPDIKRLLLQNPRDISLWSSGSIEQHLAQTLAPQLEELGLDVENVNALRHLLAQCKSLRVLHLGGPFSRQMTDRALAKAFDSTTTPPCCPALEVLELVEQRSLTSEFVGLLRQAVPSLKELRLRHCAGRLVQEARALGEAVGGQQQGGGFRVVVVQDDDEDEEAGQG